MKYLVIYKWEQNLPIVRTETFIFRLNFSNYDHYSIELDRAALSQARKRAEEIGENCKFSIFRATELNIFDLDVSV